MGDEIVDGYDAESVRLYLADVEQFPVLTDRTRSVWPKQLLRGERRQTPSPADLWP